MLTKNVLGTLAEVALIVVLSATAGIAWNRTLLTRAWHGEVTQQAKSASVLPTGQASQAQAAEAVPMPIALQQVKELHDAKGAVIIDARSTANFAEGHIAGAVVLPLQEAQKPSSIAAAVKAPKDATIIAYCNGFSCHDSIEVGKLLMRAGYSSVYVYEGGYPEWRDAGYPVAKGLK